MKRYMCLLFILLCCFSASVYAEDIKVSIEGYELKTDTPPIIMNDRVMLPVRAIFEGVGAKLTWDGDTKTLTGTKDSHAVVMTVGDEEYTIDGIKHTMDIAPAISEGRTFAPARYVAEAFGYTADWDNIKKTVAIHKENNTEEKPQKATAENTTAEKTTVEKTTVEKTTVEKTTVEKTTVENTEATTSTPVAAVSSSVLNATRSDLKKAAGNYSLGIASSVNSLKIATIRNCKSNWDFLAKTGTDKKYVGYCKQFYDKLANTAKRIDNVYNKKEYQGINEVMEECLNNKDKLKEYANRFLSAKTLDECNDILTDMQKFYNGIKTRYYEYE